MDWVIISGDEVWDSVLLNKHLRWLHIQPPLGVLRELVEDSPRPLLQVAEICRCSSLLCKMALFCVKPVFAYRWQQGMPVHHFIRACVQHSAQCTANSSFAFWNSLEFFLMFLIHGRICKFETRRYGRLTVHASLRITTVPYARASIGTRLTN